MELPHDPLQEQAYLVANGVRPVALLGSCEATRQAMSLIATRLEAHEAPGAFPFVLDRGDGYADYGFVAARWALDLYEWVTRIGADIPEAQRHRIRGLLFGYSALAIASFEEKPNGRRFEQVNAA